jgi:hypothetical protein
MKSNFIGIKGWLNMGKYVYKSKESMEKIYAFYDKALNSMNVDYNDFYIQTSFGKTHIVVFGDTTKKPIFTLHGGNGISPLNLRFFLPLLSKYFFIAPDVIGRHLFSR